MITNIKRVLQENGDVVSWKSLARACGCSEKVIRRLVKELDLGKEVRKTFKKNIKKQRELNRQNWLDTLLGLAEELGRTPSREDLQTYHIHASNFQRLFGSLTRAQKAAGLCPNSNGRPRGSKNNKPVRN